jgi:hypothetical protein
MGRKRLDRTVPPLQAVHPEFRGVDRADNVHRQLVEALRLTIRLVRTERTQHFYTQREVAAFFRVPLRTVTRVYRQLHEEGALTAIWGSATHVAGKSPGPRSPPRGVVGIPVWTHGFVLLSHWRIFFDCLEEELRRHNFVADFVFIRPGELYSYSLTERLLAHHLDHLVWLLPLTRSIPVLERLNEAGIRTTAILDYPLSAPRIATYRLEYDAGFARGLRQWRRVGATRVVLVAGGTTREAFRDTPIDRVLVRSGVPATVLPPPWSFENIPDGSFVVLPDDLMTAKIFRECGPSLIDLMRRARVMMVNCVPAGTMPPGVPVDLVRVDWEALAVRVATDIATPAAGSQAAETVVQAQWLSRVAACEWAERF